MDTGGEASTLKEGMEDFLPLSTKKKYKKGDAICSNKVVEPRQLMFQHPLNDETHRQAVDDRSDINSSHQAAPVVENKEENMSYSSVLHQMQQQQRLKPGRRCKKKTLMKMAKLFVIAQGWDSEATEASKGKSSNGRLVECEPSVSPVTSQSDIINETNSVKGRENGCDKETVLPTNSADVISSTAAKTVEELSKTCKGKRNPSTSKKKARKESNISAATERDCSTSTNLLDVPVSAQEAPLLSRPITASEVQRESKKMSSVAFKEDNKSDLTGNSPAAMSDLDVCKTQTSKQKKKSRRDPKDRGKKSIKQTFSPQISADCNDVTIPQSVTEGLLGSAVTQTDDNKAAAFTTVTERTTAAEIHNKDPSGAKSIAEVLKLKKKPGRPFKKKTLMSMAKLLAIVQEGEINSDSNGDVLFSQQPHLSQASPKVKKRKKETEITASTSSTIPARRSARTQCRSPKLKSAVEYMNSPPHISSETISLDSSRPIESIIKSEDSAGASLLVSPSDEVSVKTENQDFATENVKEKIRSRKKNAKSSLCSPDSATEQSLPPSAENDPTKTIKKDKKKRITASKSECKRDQSAVHLLSTNGISQRKQTKTAHDKVDTVISKPRKPAAKNKKCKEEAIDVPLSCQTASSVSFCDYGAMNHSASSDLFLQTSHIKTEPACEPVTPTLPNNSDSKASRRQKRKTKNASAVASNAPIKEKSGDLDVQSVEKQVEEETSRTKDPEKPPKGKRQRKSKKERTEKEKASKEQTINPDLDEKCEPGFPLTEVKKESDESHVTPIKTTKPCRKRKLPSKDMENAKKPATLTSVHGIGEEHRCLGPLGSQLVHAGEADEEIDNKGLDAAQKSLKQTGKRKRLKQEPGNAFTENPQENKKDEGRKCKKIKQKKTTSTELVSSDGKVQGVSAQPEDSFITSLTDGSQMTSLPKCRRKKKCKAVKKEPVVEKATEKMNNVIDNVLNCQDVLTTPMNENPQDVGKMMGSKKKKCKVVKEKQLISDRADDVKADEMPANPEDIKKSKGKKKCLALKNPKVEASVEENVTVAGEVPSVENGFTTSLLENALENIKDKRKKRCKIVEESLESVSSVKGFSRAVDNVNTSLKNFSENLPQAVKVKGKKKCKRVKQEQSVVTPAENNIIHTDVVSKPEDNTAASLGGRSKESPEVKIKTREKNKSLKEQLAEDGTKKKGKVPATKNNVKTSLKESLKENLRVKSKGKKKTTAAATLSDDTTEMENKVSDSQNDPTVSVGVNSEFPEAFLTRKENIKSKVTTKSKKMKLKAVKEELTTLVVEAEVLDNQNNAAKSKRKVRQPNQRSSEKQKPEKDTDILTKQERGTKSKLIGKRGKIKTREVPTSARSHKAWKVAKIEDSVSCYEPVLSSSIQDKPIPNVDLNVVKEEQDESEISELTEEAVSPCRDEIRPAESIPSVVPTGKPHTKTARKRRRTNKTGWDTKKKSKQPRTSLHCSDAAKDPHCSIETSGLSFNSSLCNSISDDEMIDLKLKEERQSTEVLCWQINTIQTPEALNRDQAEEMTDSTKLKHSAKLKHFIPHQDKLKSIKPIICSFCGRSFRHISAFTVHRRIHTGEKPYSCLKCGKRFAQLSKLHSHSNTHQQPEAVHCPCCDSKFKNKDELIAHFRTHLKDTENLNSIDDTTEGKDTNNQQMGDCMDFPAISMDSKSLRCSTCFKEFINKATFKMHQQTHVEAKPHPCTVCGKSFCKPSSLNVHEKTHWPLKPYACSVCGKGFVKLQELRGHSQMHSGPTPFFCAECGQAFSSLALLRSHQASKVCCEKQDEDGNETDIDGFLVTQGVDGQINTPMYYKCPICKQLHRHWCQYILHLQTHTNNQPYSCEICGQQYDRAPETSIHCKVCCKSSGEERACSSSLSEIWQEPEPPQSQVLEPQLDPLSSHDQSISLDADQEEHVSVSAPVETVEVEMTDMQSPPPSPNSSRLDGQSVNNDLDISSPSPNCAGEFSGPTSRSVMRNSSKQMDRQPPRFRSHSQIRSRCGRYSCGRCGKSFNRWNKLWLHQRLHRKQGRSFSCAQCDLEFRFLGSYVDHLQDHASRRPYACPLCPDAFATEETFNTHASECHKSRDCMKCSTCGKSFSSLRNLKKHRLLHKGASSHFCLPCSLSFPSSSALKTHLKSHRARLDVPQPQGFIEPFLFPYRCRKCTARFTSTELLQAHQVCHFVAEKKPTSPPADVLSCLSARAPDVQGVTSGSAQQIRSLPVSNKKYLFRYPHPDRLYVVPVISSEPPVVISDTEEECLEIDIRSPSIPTSSNNTVLPHFPEGQPDASNDSSDQNTSNILQSSALSTPMDMDEPVRYRPVTETGSAHHPVQDPLVYSRSSDKPPVHSESHQNHDTSGDIKVISDCDNDSAEASTVLMISKEKELLNDVHACAVCTETFTDVLKLHQHYLDHARGVKRWDQ